MSFTQPHRTVVGTPVVSGTNNAVLYTNGSTNVAQTAAPSANQILGVSGDVPTWINQSGINHASLSNLTWSTAGHTIDTTFSPNADAARALGTTALRWTNLFLSGSIFDSSGNNIFLRRDGTVPLTGNWSTGSSKILANTSFTSGQFNVAVNGTTTPGVHFPVGTTATETLWTSTQGNASGGWYGFRMIQDESSTGNTFYQGVNNGVATTLIAYRRSGGIRVGTADPGSPLGGEILAVNGLIHSAGGVTMNEDRGTTDPNHLFKYFDSGSGYAMAIDPNATTGGVVFFGASYASLGGVFNFSSRRASANQAGLNIIMTGSFSDYLPIWFAESGNYGSGAYGFGALLDNASTGDMRWFAKNGSATDSGLIYWDRTNQYVGIGPGFTFAAKPIYPLDVNGKIHTDNEIEIDGALNHDGTTVGLYGVTPVTRPTAYTQTYSTATKTHANLTSADIGAFTGGSVGFLDAAERDNIRTQFNALKADLTNLKGVVNAIIDDGQAVGNLQ